MTEVRVPDIGDFTDVPVIELLVVVGDEVGAEDPLLTLESDKATMDVPAPEAGTVEEILVAVGDTVGVIRDPYGDVASRMRARKPGFVIGHTLNPLVNRGDAVVHIAHVEPGSGEAGEKPE